MTCRNPECRDGRTPGLIARGLGNAKTPVLGAKMTWGWVPCPACNDDPNARNAGVSFKLVHRSSEEMERRRQLADEKAPYKQEAPIAKSLGLLKVTAPAATADHSAQMAKLLEQVTKLTEQVSELLAENRQLRKQLEARPVSVTQAMVQ